MACGGCKNGNGNRHASTGGGDLRRFAFLSPRQLKRLKEMDDAEAAKNPPAPEEQE
jgi:hypothetical protein